jgi:hypothetical protein
MIQPKLIKQVYSFTKQFRVNNPADKTFEDVDLSIDLYLHHDTQRYHLDWNAAFDVDKGLIQVAGDPNSFGHLMDNVEIAIEFYKWIAEINSFAATEFKALEEISKPQPPAKETRPYPGFSPKDLIQHYERSCRTIANATLDVEGHLDEGDAIDDGTWGRICRYINRGLDKPAPTLSKKAAFMSYKNLTIANLVDHNLTLVHQFASSVLEWAGQKSELSETEMYSLSQYLTVDTDERRETSLPVLYRIDSYRIDSPDDLLRSHPQKVRTIVNKWREFTEQRKTEIAPGRWDTFVSRFLTNSIDNDKDDELPE